MSASRETHECIDWRELKHGSVRSCKGENRKLSKAYQSEFHTTDLVSQIFPPLADLCVPLDPRCHAERGQSTRSCKEKVSDRQSRRTMTDASCDHSLLDLMHVRHDHSATPVVAPAGGYGKTRYLTTISTKGGTLQNKMSFCSRICRPFSA
jgi:hypothetical protein